MSAASLTDQTDQNSQAQTTPKIKPPTWPRFALPLSVALTFLARFSEGRRLDHDVFHALSLWRETTQRGSVPTQDIWAYTETVGTVVHHEWLTGGLNYLLAVSTGWGSEALLAWKAACSLGAIACVWGVARLRGASHVGIAFAAIPAMMFSMVSVGTGRAQVTTVFLFALLLLFLELDRLGKRWWIAAWLLIFPIWLNLHGGVVAGCGVLALHTVERTLRVSVANRSVPVGLRETWHLWLTGIVLFPMFLLNPYGVEYVTYLLEALSMDRSHISEWWPLYRTVSNLRLIFFAGMCLTAAACVYRRGLVTTPGVLLLTVLGVVAFQQTRQVCFFAIVWLAYVPGWLVGSKFADALRNKWQQQRSFLGTAAIGWALVMLLHLQILGAPWKVKIPLTSDHGPSYYPTGLASFLEEHDFSGDVVTSFETGAWISWKLHPHVKVSFDSRYEATYPGHVFEDTLSLYGAHDDWLEALDRLQGDAIILPKFYPIHAAWQANPPAGWKIVYTDDAQIFAIREASAETLPVVDARGQTLPLDIF